MKIDTYKKNTSPFKNINKENTSPSRNQTTESNIILLKSNT